MSEPSSWQGSKDAHPSDELGEDEIEGTDRGDGGHPQFSGTGAREELEIYRTELEMQNEELRSTQVDLEVSRRRFSELFDLAPVGYLVLDLDGRIKESNIAASKLLNTDRALLLRRSPSMYMRGQGLLEFRRVFRKVVAEQSVAQLEAVFHCHNNGRSFDSFIEMSTARTSDSGEVVCMMTIIDIGSQKVAERKAIELTKKLQNANRELTQMAHLDVLTKLLNRRGLELELVRELSRRDRDETSLSALLIDCDDFKQINDRLGHATGDVALAELAERFVKTLRPTDIVGRIGGDEFMVLLPGTDLQSAGSAAERLRLAISSTPILFSGEPITLTVSVGALLVPKDAASIEEVLSLCHGSMKSSKNSGKNVVSLGRRVLGTEAPPWRSERGVISVCQPIVSLPKATIVGYEVLTRIPDEDFGPEELFRRASDCGELTALDLHCIRKGVQLVADAPAKMMFHINVLPSTLLATSPTKLIELLSVNENFDCVAIELSEQQLIGDQQRLAEHLAPLRELGIQLVMDDLGFGRTSLEALLVLEPDVVKIDKSLVQAASTSPQQRKILVRLLRMLQAIEVPAVAEGVETREQEQMLVDLSVEYGQGYLWGRPAVPNWGD